MDAMDRATYAVGALVLALSSSACGGDGGGDAGGDAGGAADLQTIATEYQFEPSSWTVEAGADTSIRVDNEGQIVHEWVVLAEGRTIESEDELPEDESVFESEWVDTEVEVEAGESATHEFTAPAAGTYQVICAIPGHFDAGMEGTLTVE